MKYLDQLYLAEVLVKPMAECLFVNYPTQTSPLNTNNNATCINYDQAGSRFCLSFEAGDASLACPTSLYYERYSFLLLTSPSWA